MLGTDDPSHAQINFHEIIDRTLVGHRFVLERLITIVELAGQSDLGCRCFGRICFCFCFIHHLLNVLFFNSFHHVLEFRDRRTCQRRLRLIPIGNRFAQQFTRLFGQFGQNRCQVNHDLPEQVDRDRANILKLLSFLWVFFQCPRSRIFDEWVGSIRQLHDQPHRFVVVACFVSFGDGVARGGPLLEQTTIIGVSF